MRRLCLLLALALASTRLGAQSGVHGLGAELGASALAPESWASDSPRLTHLGYEVSFGIEYSSPISLLLRLEAGYIGVSASGISSSGELYRAWEGGRVALLAGYYFGSFRLGSLGMIEVAFLGGGALTAADFTGTALAFAYPSVVLEPRLSLDLASASARQILTGPSLSIPVELMFRAGTYTLAPGLSLGWRYRLGVWP